MLTILEILLLYIIIIQSQTNAHLLPRLLAPSVLHLLETTTATMSMTNRSLYSLPTAAVVGVMPTRLVFKTRSLEPDSGIRLRHHFVRQRAVALKVI